MASEEYWQGRNLEKNQTLHEECKRIFNFESVESDGSSNTKGDIIGIIGTERIHVSVKYASGQNTQVHLPTLKSFAESLNMPDDIRDLLDKFLGTEDLTKWNEWIQNKSVDATELKYQRIKSSHLDDWNKVITYFNDHRRLIATFLLQSLNDEHPAPYLIWANKKKGGYQAVDINKLVDWIASDCEWVSMDSGTTIRCVLPLEEGKKKRKPIFWLQMKNSGPAKGQRYNHSPQFHLVCNWPKEFVLYENKEVRFNENVVIDININAIPEIVEGDNLITQ